MYPASIRSRVKHLSFLMLTLGTLSACSEAPQQGGHAMPPAQVSVQQVTTQSVPFDIELPATLAGDKEVEIRSRVSGIIESRNFEEGQFVKAGHSLFTIELKPFELAVEKAQAALQAAKANVDQTKRESERLERLKNERSVSKRDFDNSVSAYDIAVANLESAKVALSEAKLDLEYAKVEAPVSGIVGRELMSEGSYVSGPSVLLTELTDISTIRARFGFSEREQLTMRQDVENGSLSLPENNEFDTTIILQDGSLYGQAGKVNFSDVRVNRFTGTSELQARIPNENGELRPGQFVRVKLSGAVRNNAVVLPQRAVLDNGTGKFVYIATKNEQGATVALPAPVKVGEWVKLNNENMWVIREGLKEGQPVIVEGMARIFFPGMPVSVSEQGE
ncbi:MULTISPECIES: efflux RND transporter periplasmic adaptor subunit [Pseudoalteromonas]|uniref:efflux RND transporter periplasmic adaptor subunit n=1 Tax=Pseudoalteromonas TaxID=53246 RepID=UPI000580246D|nr:MULTISPECIES: efflux RND transporter periplasmic adaptor subunit [Pseudoalteromonas]KID34710.1 MFP transporter [Pseudoalteromonas flavipulchra NCIMB 2033 = ATCC BAA-314]MBD0781373.1 efflux RND transporter periplasmic adaptor subunit [Pseudoalteromonas flavipulchra]MBE0372739.1 membrane fusion protein [Pseudoalteromonas flavipulchra NCIMB 2033 = ATCC BAA-314]MCG7542204.1 efflux RND transporter periplasmic adaptor subunit [Pseudoalteromonas sp. OF7H-1]MCG9770750.1 efflux RND transporter perip